MGQRIFIGVMALVAIALVGWVVRHQLANRELVAQSLEAFSAEVLASVPAGPERDRAAEVLRRYVASSTGFERTVTRSDLFLSRQQLAAAAADSLVTADEAVALVDLMDGQMGDSGTTFLRPADGGVR